jgi:hypothetical protein
MPRSDERLTRELDNLRAAGHVLGPWSVADPDLARELNLLDSAQQCTCVCGLILLAGWDTAGTFAVVRGVSGAYSPEASAEAIDADLETRRGRPCPAAHARESFHASAGYQRFAECFND